MHALLHAGAPKLVRHLLSPSSATQPIQEFDHGRVLQELGLTEDQFIDVCILCTL